MSKEQTTRTPTDVETWLDNLDPSDPHINVRGGRHMRRIAAAARQLAEVDAELTAAVIAAREAGDSWAMIGTALGISRQGAFQRFGKIAPR